jgi:hypothetical protein
VANAGAGAIFFFSLRVLSKWQPIRKTLVLKVNVRVRR